MKHLNDRRCLRRRRLLPFEPNAREPNSVEHALRELQPSSVIEYTRMVGGESTPWSEWPWQTALYRVSNGREIFTCGGSLVAPGWVLSAAHCFGEGSSDNPADWTVATHIAKATMVGLPPGAETRKVKRLVVHEGYDKNIAGKRYRAYGTGGARCRNRSSRFNWSRIQPRRSNRSVTVTGWGMTRWVVRKEDKSGHVDLRRWRSRTTRST